jgi:hypothetical protein
MGISTMVFIKRVTRLSRRVLVLTNLPAVKNSGILMAKMPMASLTGEPNNLINADDMTIIGDPNPDFIFGFNNEFKYKNFDLVVFVNGSQGNDIYSFVLQELETLGNYGYNSTKKALDRWSPTNTNTDVPMKDIKRSLKPSSSVG